MYILNVGELVNDLKPNDQQNTRENYRRFTVNAKIRFQKIYSEDLWRFYTKKEFFRSCLQIISSISISLIIISK